MSRHHWHEREAEALKAAATGAGSWSVAADRAAAVLGWRPSRNQAQGALANRGVQLAELLHAPASAGVSVTKTTSAATPANLASAPELSQPAPTSTPPEPVAGIDWTGARPTTAAAIERRVILADAHLPVHSATALACAYAVIRALQPHRVIHLGDLLNNQAFSNHAPYSPDPERYDLASLAARAFIRSVKQAAPGAELYLLTGNHDAWPQRWESLNPNMRGSQDLEIRLGIRSQDDDPRPPMFEGVHLVTHPEERPLTLGPVAYIHGNGGGIYAAKRYAETIGPRHGIKTVVAGHHHTLQYHRTKAGYEAWLCPWLGDERQPAFHYAPAPRPWLTGLLVQDVSGDRVTTTPVEIDGGVAFFGGRLIGGRDG